MDVQLRSVWVDADPHRLNQIITNLVNNAVRHTPPDGAIRVRTADEGEHALLRVEDGGAGISAELLPQVFDPFTQGEQGPERAHGGLGVGLTLVRQLAELHGGRVEAHSAGRGRGSTFTVRLPRSLAPITAHSAAAAAVRAGRSCRILLVEEHSDARESLRVLLEIMGHEVHEAADGQAGVQAAGALRPVYALVDVGLPRMAGYEVARRIKVAHPDVRLIAVTGCGEDDDQERAKAAGFDAYLLTPVRPEQLQRVMDELFTGAELPADRNAAA
jgi:CheY-like chemotaxis protein/anti-sigma regulatory factor (Ser/Thr protein kinase)